MNSSLCLSGKSQSSTLSWKRERPELLCITTSWLKVLLCERGTRTPIEIETIENVVIGQTGTAEAAVQSRIRIVEEIQTGMRTGEGVIAKTGRRGSVAGVLLTGVGEGSKPGLSFPKLDN